MLKDKCDLSISRHVRYVHSYCYLFKGHDTLKSQNPQNVLQMSDGNDLVIA